MKIKNLFSIGIIFLTTIFVLSLAQPIAARSMNPVVWKTNYAKLAASDFYIRIKDTYYYGADQVRVSSDPGTKRTTLQLIWDENQVKMRINFYFRKTDQNEWELYDLRTSDGTANSSWIYYSPQDSLGNNVSSIPGYHSYAYERRFLPKSNVDAEIFCKECSINAFLNMPLKYSSHGYALEVMHGLEANQTITTSTNPMTGYGVNVLLRNQDGQVVTNQQGMTYQWQPRNTNIVSVVAQDIKYANGDCAFGIMAPCPNVSGQLEGLSPGVTIIDVNVLRNGIVIASNEFDVKVVAHDPAVNVSPSPISSPTPSIKPSTAPVAPTTTPTDDDYEQLQKEIESLKGTVGEIKLDVKQQRQDLNLLQQLIASIMSFFRNIPWFRKIGD